MARQLFNSDVIRSSVKPRSTAPTSSAKHQSKLIVALIALLLVCGAAFLKFRSPIEGSDKGSFSANQDDVKEQDTAVIRALVDAEETSLVLNRRMTVLSKALLDLRLPGPGTDANSVFLESVTTMDLLPKLQNIPPKNSKFETHAWPVSAVKTQTSTVDLWRPMLDEISCFEHAKLSIFSGIHPEGDMWEYEATGGFEALASMRSGEWRLLKGSMDLTWQRSDSAGAGWQISNWKTTSMEWVESSRPLFSETLDTAMRIPQETANLRRSLHYEATVRHYRDGMQQLPHPYFAPISVNQKEGLAVSDVNGDGFDDIYITVRIGKNMLLVNQGDGTFVEQAASFKLDLPGHTTCALFADFDNDGDQDVILGRSLLKTSYLENRDGIFHQHPIPDFMPMAVISMSASDFNMDGLLDVYICTYRPAAPAGASPAGGVAQDSEDGFDWPDEFFDANQAREYRQRVSAHRQKKGGTVLDQLGPPNLLLINRGNGKFEPAPENDTVGIWRNSLQGTWGDYNLDGRPDLYIANDWGLDVLFRNEATGGFTDVSQESGLTSYGYAMGASWGDYDNDGQEDLYVSNMYSEPGRRITKRIPGLEKMFIESAAGNWLYHKEDNGQYKQVAGMSSPLMKVMNAGWSWGGCFTDFDNDSFLDLYVLSGYFTAPKELASGLDLESNLWRTMVRTDNELARSSFRLSPEWKRTSAPDNLGPIIDARLAGVERQGEKVLVHSLNGNERNHYFENHAGRSFSDISALSGLDNVADSRGFAVLDYDRDGWQDVALVNANEPLFNLYHNDMQAAGLSGGLIALRFVGGNTQATGSKEFGCRDGYGARVWVDLGETQLVREHRCGDGWSTQNSSTMIVGIGSHKSVAALNVTWPSGRTTTTQNIPEGTLLTLHENPAHSSSQNGVELTDYRVETIQQNTPPKNRSVFPIAAADKSANPNFRLRVYTAFSTTNVPYKKNLPRLKYLREQLRPEGVDFIAVPIDEADDDEKLGEYARVFQPSTRLMRVALNQRVGVASIFSKVFGAEAPVPSSVVTDSGGNILGIQNSVPGISVLRKHLTTLEQ